jgi:hypothetical protein
LDFEWRFNNSTSKELLERAATRFGSNDYTLLLGTPTLAVQTAQCSESHSCVYIGEDNVITTNVCTLNERLGHPIEVRLCGPGALGPGEAGLILLDPPWYFDFWRPMLRAAAYACRAGGHVLLSLPPVGTNSHAGDDRIRLIKLFAKLSLNIVSITPNAIYYDTPFFEANALAAKGYPNIPSSWRRGDLVVLEKAHQTADFELGFLARQRGWHEVVIDRMRLFITKRMPRCDTAMDELRSIVPGDILPSVRRTDPRRQHADVWTSGNRIFATGRPDLVRIAALIASSCSLIDDWDRLSKTEKDAVVRLRYVLGELAIKERAEERRCGFEEAACPALSKSRSGILRITSHLTRSGGPISHAQSRRRR